MNRPSLIAQVLALFAFAAPVLASDLVLRSGRIVTVDPNFRVVEAMAVENGRVVSIGSNSEIAQRITPETQVIDLKGKMVLPGLIDSHVHPGGASMYEADHEVPAMDRVGDVLDYVRQRASVVPKGEWIVLQQVFITRLREQRFPTRQELDSVAPENPVWFRTGPDGSANSLALAANGIDKAFAAKHPDHVPVDPRTGEPTGVIRQSSAILKVRGGGDGGGRDRAFSQTERDQRLHDLLKDYSRWGITGIIDRNCSDAGRAQYARLLEADRLPLRVRLSRGLNPKLNATATDEFLDSLVADPLFQNPNPRLAIIGVKVFEDGGMLTGSAYFNRPWGASAIYGIVDPRYRGMQYIDSKRLETLIRKCVRRSLAFTAHCQGDAAVEALVKAYEVVDKEIPIEPTRSTITHSSFMSPQAIEGAARIGVGVDLQPAWLYLDARTLVSQFGEDRLKYFIPLRSLFEAGVIAGGGSDHMQKIGSLRSVNPYNPFLGMWIAVTRTARWHDDPIHPEQSLSREQMIRFYTINNAYLMRSETEVGSLEPGKRADFIVVDRDLLTCKDAELRETQVLSTWLDGERIYSLE